MMESVSLGFLGLSVPVGTHLCAFFRGPEGRDEIVMPYRAEGIRAKDKCICILESLMPAGVLSRLAGQVDIGSSVETGGLELHTPDEAYLRSGRFSAEEMLEYWGQSAEATQSSGDFSLTRATGEMPSVLHRTAGRDEFFRYESMLNDFVATYPQVILCLYNLETAGAEVLIDTLRTHPQVVVDGMINENPYYIEPGKFLVGRG